MKIRVNLLLLSVALIGSGCVGFNSTLFTTKSNLGLDVETKPPTAEISMARRELVISPSFEKGKVPPVAASFNPKTGIGGAFSSYLFGVDQTFSGGDASVALAKLYKGPTPDTVTSTNRTRYDSSLHLEHEPHQVGKGGILSWLFGTPREGAVRPFAFGTDTTFGLKMGWSGVSSQYPDTVQMGFRRKELALASVFVEQEEEHYVAQMPSFLATIDTKAKAEGTSAQVESIQYFATGDTATTLALHRDVRQAFIERLEGRRVEATYGKNKASKLLRDYWKPDGEIDPAHEKEIRNWLRNHGLDAKLPITVFIYGKKYKDERNEAVKDLELENSN